MQTPDPMIPTPEDWQTLEGIYKEYANKKSLMIHLQQIQGHFGFVPPYAIEFISKKTNISESHIYGVLTFYAQFSTTPVGKNIIKICQGTACHVGGSKVLIKKLKSYLKLKENEETTADLLFTVQPVACLGCCALAPAMMVNDKVYGTLDQDRMKEVVEQYRQESEKDM